MYKVLRTWFTRHRKAVLVSATVLAITGTVAVLLIKGKKVEIPLEKLAKKIVPNDLKQVESIAQTVSVEIDGVVKTFPRKAFIRQLHEGWKPSPAKIAEAEMLNIELKPGETLVKPCTVTMRIAA